MNISDFSFKFGTIHVKLEHFGVKS